MKLLITAGATREPIDAVRFLSNVSTGLTGAALADAFVSAGHDVVLLHGVSSARPRLDFDRETFTSADDLSARLRNRLAGGAFDAVIMTAAVSDYRPAVPVEGKISSVTSELTVRLVRNEKILPQLKGFSPRSLCVIGFKLTAGATESARRAAVEAQFNAGGVDFVVHNDLDEIRAAPRASHPFRLYMFSGADPQELRGVPALAHAVGSLLAACRGSSRNSSANPGEL